MNGPATMALHVYEVQEIGGEIQIRVERRRPTQKPVA